MATRIRRQDDPRASRRGCIRLASAIFGLTAIAAPLATGADSGRSADTVYYSTAASPPQYVGPQPRLLAFNETAPRSDAEQRPAAAPRPGVHAIEPADAPRPAPASAPTRVASNASSRSVTAPSVPASPSAPATIAETPKPDPIAMAKKAIADCQVRYAHIRDYSCVFLKRERINGRLTTQHVMHMKARTSPASVYFKFQQPNKGREAIYVAGRNGGNVVAHDVGLGRLVAGTLHLDPRGSRAMEDCRHPITEAGIGALIDTVATHWARELTPAESEIKFHHNILVGKRPCTMIESIHPNHRPEFMFHKVKLYIDHEHGVPIRFEAFDWPKLPGTAGELVEEYTYHNLQVNVGLRDHDFDPGNSQYSFGRF